MSHDTQHVLKLLTRARLSDGAKVTFVEFWLRKLAGTAPPTYTELERVRNLARSAIQRHVGELEHSGLLRSIRLPDNRKVYTLHPATLSAPKPAARKEAVKPVGPYGTSELCQLFLFRAGIERTATRQEYALMRRMHREHGAVLLAKMIDCFAAHYRRHSWGAYTMENMEERVDMLKSIVLAHADCS